MTGWKTILAAVLSIGYGVAGQCLGLHESDTTAQFITQGIALLGIGHKIDKLGGSNANNP